MQMKNAKKKSRNSETVMDLLKRSIHESQLKVRLLESQNVELKRFIQRLREYNS
jgi:hypothetical protein